MPRGPDRQPRKQRALQYTPPQFVTEDEAVSKMGATIEEVRALENCGSVSYPSQAPTPIYQFTQLEKVITARGGTVGKVE